MPNKNLDWNWLEKCVPIENDDIDMDNSSDPGARFKIDLNKIQDMIERTVDIEKWYDSNTGNSVI